MTKMPVPDFESLMLPLLRITADGQEHRLSETIEALAHELHLSEEDRNELLPSGRQAKFDNRVGWARTYLSKAGLLVSTGRGRFRITERGLEVLANPPDDLTVGFLQQYPEFKEFYRPPSQETKEEENDRETDQTPEEILESSYQELRRSLAHEILERIRTCSPKFFERLVVDLLVAMGYGGSRQDAGQAVGHTGDDGIDGIIKEDKLGLDIVYVQAKRWKTVVGKPIVQAFAGSLEGQRAKKGVLITTSQFSKDAREYIGKIEKKIVLIDGEQLAELMIDHDVGVTPVANYVVKRVDLDYFEED